MEPKHMSITFFITILAAFFALVKPVSTMAKPGCMAKTKNAPISTQIVSADTYFPIVNHPSKKSKIEYHKARVYFFKRF